MTTTHPIPFRTTLGHRDAFERWLSANLDRIGATTEHCPLVELLPVLRAAFLAGVASARAGKEATA